MLFSSSFKHAFRYTSPRSISVHNFPRLRTFATMTTDTSKYKFNHSMMRVKDPAKTVKFYEFLGMKLVNKMEFPDNKFDLYFLAYDSPNATSSGNHWTDREGIIELTHNYGSETDEKFKVSTGNEAKPSLGKGFGHICVSVDNIQAACQRLEDAGYAFKKKLKDGRMHHIAFALDPDGYWVEIIAQNDVEKTESVKETNTDVYRMNHTMIRVKDAEKSLSFYQDVMGMELKRTHEAKEAKFNLYFLGYGPPASEKTANGVNPTADREGLLELTWNYEPEEGDTPYYNGNTAPKDGQGPEQGFGHICVSVDDLDSACSRFESLVPEKAWQKKLHKGRMKGVAFIKDPDGYWIEVIQNEKLKKRANW